MGRQVLIVYDDLTTTTILKGVLEKNDYLVSIAHSGIDAIKMIDEGDLIYEILIIDWFMPDLSGIELTKEIRQRNLPITPYIMILTSNPGSDTELHAIESGADDFMQKPFFVEKLQARLVVASRTIEYQKKILEMANYDSLTGLLNRRAGFLEGSKQLSRMQRDNSIREQTIILCDIDYFKSINDNYGHAYGDLVLQFVSKTCSNSLRPYETIVRYGGEEFLVILEAGSEELKSVLMRLSQMLSKPIQDPLGINTSITMSYGCLIVDRTNLAMDFVTLIDFADQLLYEAKGSGRNRAITGKLMNQANLEIIAEIAF